MYTFESLFGAYLDKTMLEELSSVQITKCNLDTKTRTLSLCLQSDKYVTNALMEKMKQRITAALKLSGINIDATYSKDCLCAESAEDIVHEIRLKSVVLNGFFNESEYNLEQDTLTITLKYGGMKCIEKSDFVKQLKREVLKRFNRDIEVKFEGQLEDKPIEMPPPEIIRESAPKKAEKTEETKEKKFAGVPKDNLPVYLDSAKLFFGRSISTDVQKLSEIVPPSNPDESIRIAAWGEVFGSEIREVDTRRGGKMVIAKFFFSDSSNSFSASVRKYFDPKYSKDMKADAADFAASLKPLRDGACVVVNGDYAFDKWANEFVVDVKALATLQKYEPCDSHEGEKRVELHCHTNMSAKDAVASASDIINLAYKWGHKAVAITDHGVVQAYPEAAAAVSSIRKSGGEFKVIYGVEGYFIDDTRYDITALSTKEIARLRNHQIILVKNLVGLKNLYKIISNAHLENFHGRPIILRSVLEANREGLIIGSACEQGELYRAIVDGKPREELIEIAKFYDYLEIQPLGNNEFMVRDSALPDKTDKKTGQVIPNRFKHVVSLEVIKDFNRKVVQIADELSLPVVATGDVHFLRREDGIIRQIVMAGQGFDDIEYQAPLHFKTTDEMLAEFEYFGVRAKEFVIDNPNKIADMVSDDVIPVPKGNYPPVIEGSDELLREICWDNAHRIYGDTVPEVVEKRLNKELDSIINNGFSIMYISAQKLVAYSEEKGYLVGSRGSVGSSFVATMAGISEVNPLPPHYVCPICRHSEFFLKGEVGSGFDLPEKNCPNCSAPMNRNGHDIPFETFLGFKGDKVPDIDLNFSDEVQNDVQEFTKTLFGAGNVYKAGTISTIAEKTAFGFSKAYAEKMGITLSKAELNRLANMVNNAGVKTTTGQHPAGMIIVPDGMEIYDFCPVQHPADDVNSDIITTHFDFHSIHDTILKLDELGHVVPTTYKYLEEYTGVGVNTVTMSDSKVYSLFTSPEALGVTSEQIYSKTGTFCLPEFGTPFVREMLVDCKPKNFSDLLQISGLSHGTDVYLGNAKDLIESGTCTISEVIGTRDNIMVYLIHQGMAEDRAFKITETVRKGLVAKGKVSKEDWDSMSNDMLSLGVPQWYVDSCHKIKYMFPKAHAAAYVISALRLAWYKVYRPLEFYCAYFTARPEDVDVPTIVKGQDAVRAKIAEIADKDTRGEATKKEKDVYNNLLIFNEMMSRGIEVLPIDVKHSSAMKYVPEQGKMRLPFGALSGVGDKAAFSIYEAAQKGNFVSKEDFAIEAGVSRTIIQNLSDLGALNDLPDTNQISLF